MSLHNLALMTVAAGGTGAIKLSGAAIVNGVPYLTFAQSGAIDGETLHYAINDVNGSEVGSGTWTAATQTLTRTPVNSTDSGNPINVSPAGLVSISPLASDFGLTSFANPTASVGLTAVNGSASTAMRSDAAPALSQSIVPTWTGLHTFSGGLTVAGSFTAPGLVTNTDLANSSVTINGSSVSLGGSVTVSATPSGAAGGDLTGSYPIPTLATVNSNVGTFGSATQSAQITVNAKGQTTAALNTTITPAVGSITGLGTGVATALGNTAGGAGGFALVSGANVASVSNSDGTLTISPTTGAVVASLALGHANTWTGTQSFAAVNATGIIASTNTTSGTSTTTAAITGKSLGLTENLWVGGNLNAGNINMTGGFNNTAVNGNMEFGSLTTANTPFFDFHSSGNNNDYDFRILAIGGNASSGNGSLLLFGTGGTSFNGPMSNSATTASTSTTTGSLVNSGGFGNAGAIFGGSSILSTGTGGIGYATGAGGSVTQITSRNTGVILSKISGDIVLLSGINAAVSAATANTVIVTNTTVAITDTISISQKSGTDKYLIFVTNVAAGSFTITFFTTGGTTNESPVFHFNVIKGVNS